ncbi:MAG TPA: cation-translocating P-type ATPase [Actinomycetota bacterium]|nr:cation-translocating P-type ATPase [Actinomycetota bacterium]
MPAPHAENADRVVSELGSDPQRGLDEAEARARLQSQGPNELRGVPQVPGWRRFLGQFADPLVLLLIGAVVVSLAVWLIEGSHGIPFEALAIVLIVLINAVLGYIQEERAERAVAALRRMTTTTVAVVRDDRSRRVPSTELVRGDVILLEEGDAISADARLLDVTALQVAEASLTGESQPVAKEIDPVAEEAVLGDRRNMVFGGTVATFGRGTAVVVATGMDTEMGHIAGMIQRAPAQTTPLQLEIDRVGHLLGIAVVLIAAIVIGTILLTSDVTGTDALVEVMLLGVSLAVAAVPEGLATVLTVVLALGVQRMAGRHAIVKKLAAVETLGSATVVCTDKTGTLTKNEMTVRTILTASGRVELTGAGYEPNGEVIVDGKPLDDGDLRVEVRRALGAATLASNAQLSNEDGTWIVVGDPTEGALLVAARKAGIDAGYIDERFKRVDETPFSSERKLMSTVQTDSENPDLVNVFVKGAPDVLLARCTHEFVGSEAVPLDDARRTAILDGIEELAGEALRTLGVASRPISRGSYEGAQEDFEHELAYVGVAGIIDPPRTEATDAVARAHRAGVRVIMITGDHPGTAVAIASELGIVESGAVAATGARLQAMDDDELLETVRRVSVYARVSPEHKLRIVRALKRDGHVVAMTGDGVNDAPALKSADIGVAMGITGTEVSKEAADMILTDDNFATIVAAIEEGRAIFSNIRKFIRYLLSSNVGEVMTVFFGVLLAGLIGLTGSASGGLVVPLLATQILWINLLTDAAPALAVGVDPPDQRVMEGPPRSRSDRLIDARMWTGILVVGATMAVATLLTLDFGLPGGLIEGDLELSEARTMAFTVLVLAQLFNVFNSRSDTVTAARRLFRNRWLWAAVGLSLSLQFAVVYLPLLNEAFDTRPLDLGQWLVCFAMASIVLWVNEIKKLLLRA